MVDGMWTVVLPSLALYDVIAGKGPDGYTAIKHRTAQKAQAFCDKLNKAPKTSVTWVVVNDKSGFYVAHYAVQTIKKVQPVKPAKEETPYDRYYNIGGKWVSWEYMMST